MNLPGARVVLRPRALADVLDLALPFCVASLRPLGVLSLLLLPPVAAAVGWLRIRHQWPWGSLWLLVALASLLLEGAFTVAVAELLFHEPRQVRVRKVLATFARRFPAYLLALLVRELALVASAMLVVLPFFTGPATLFTGEALLLETAPLGRAFSRSRALGRDRAGFCVGLWLATLALPVVGAVVADLVFDTLAMSVLQLGQLTGNLAKGGSGFAVLGALLAMPVAAAVRFLGYIDLRTRKEGWDLQLRFASLAAGEQPAGPDVRRAA